MLNHAQIQTLAKIGRLGVRCCDGIPISVSCASNRKIKYPYDQFRKEMGLEDLRLNWLLGSNNMIAGGSVLNWIWGENTQGDIDFFFKDEESADIFVEFIKPIGFKLTAETNYAATYFESLQGLILQVVGDSTHRADHSPYNSPAAQEIVAYGTPEIIIDNFDFHVCKFAVDSDYLHTTSRAIQDLLKMTIDNTGKEKNYLISRILKYNRKGFFLSPKIKRYMKYDKPIIQNKDRDEQKWI